MDRFEEAFAIKSIMVYYDVYFIGMIEIFGFVCTRGVGLLPTQAKY